MNRPKSGIWNLRSAAVALLLAAALLAGGCKAVDLSAAMRAEVDRIIIVSDEALARDKDGKLSSEDKSAVIAKQNTLFHLIRDADDGKGPQQ